MRFEKVPTIVVLCLLPVLVSLGVWQLHRAQEKQIYFDLLKRNNLADAVTITAAAADAVGALRYRRAMASGQYDADHQFLLDNQISGGKPGYFVLTPFLLDGGKAVLVNRGWIPSTGNRSKLPDIGMKSMSAEISGRINAFPSVAIKLPGADKPAPGWPSLVQVVDAARLAEALGYPVFGFMIELDKTLPGGYRREWREPAVMPPQQHVAYAYQWFGLAVTLALLFVWYSRLK